MMPLWTTETPPETCGWAFLSEGTPCVAQRVWPMPIWPCRFCSPASLASVASGARPAVPRQRSAVISAKHTKCAALSQCGGRRWAPMKRSASIKPAPVARQAKRSVGILLLQHHDDRLQDDLQIEEQRPV